MSEYLFDHLAFARATTLLVVEGVSESGATKIPEGFNNNILWNLGHVYLSLERFALHFAGEPVQIPESFATFFGGGTKPVDWVGEPPALAEVLELLKEQPNRIREKLQNRLNETVAQPITIRNVKLSTVGELLSFSLFPEGMHVQNLKILRRVNSENE